MRWCMFPLRSVGATLMDDPKQLRERAVRRTTLRKDISLDYATTDLVLAIVHHRLIFTLAGILAFEIGTMSLTMSLSCACLLMALKFAAPQTLVRFLR
jgi:hypothetical protein